MSKLGWEFVIENHKFRDIDIQLQSSYIVIPYKGEYKEVIVLTAKLLPTWVFTYGRPSFKSQVLSFYIRDLKG